MKIGDRYKLNKESKIGDECICPSCGTKFIKNNYQQSFCKSKTGTKCKGKYWNTVTSKKRNNTTRISPASRAWSASRIHSDAVNFDPDDAEHVFSTGAHGQWDD